MRLSETIVMRITPEMKEAINAEAKRLRLRSIDVIRFALSSYLAHIESDKDISEKNDGKR